MTSEGALVLSTGGRTCIPDFVVRKATQYDITLLVVEIKVKEPKDKERWYLSTVQLDEYMHVATQQRQHDSRLVGLLICGTSVQISMLHDRGQEIVIDKEIYVLTSNASGRALWHLLLQVGIAVENWTYTA